MTFMLEIRRRGRHVAGSILGVLLFSYFLFHAIQGDRGLFAWVQINQQIRHASADLDRSINIRETWEKRIGLMRSANLDPGMLDERVRIVTGLGRRDELIIFHSATGSTGTKR